MRSSPVQSGQTARGGVGGRPPVDERLRAAGIVLLHCGERGDAVRQPPALSTPHDDWLCRLVTGSPSIISALAEACEQWHGTETPAPREGPPGFWLLPVPRRQRRGRRNGFAVGVVATDAAITSEALPKICRAAGLKLNDVRRRLRELPPAAESDVDRLHLLVQCVCEDDALIELNTQHVESVGQSLAESYEEINLLYTIIQDMTVRERPERFVRTVCNELLATIPYTWIGVQLADDEPSLKGLAGKWIVTGEPADLDLDAAQRTASELLAEMEPDTPMVIEPAFNARHARYGPLGNTVLVQPINTSERVIGVLVACDKQGADQAASSVDMKLLAASATHMAIFLENAALYEDLNSMFLGTLEALTASIDAKDRYTCGHSQRVALLTHMLAEAIGMEEQQVRRMHIAGLVHDVGKIGVPESVLTKPGRLTEHEFEWVRRHPEMGHRILRDIPQLRDILPGVLHHHERWDGKGYPHGLAGDAIPLVAQLIGLADAFDAMSSTRTYRSAMSRPQVLKEIQRCAGTQFAPELVPVFLALDFRAYDSMVTLHRANGDVIPRGVEAA